MMLNSIALVFIGALWFVVGESLASIVGSFLAGFAIGTGLIYIFIKD